MSHDGEDYTQIAFLRSDIDDSTGEYTERFEAGSFDMPAADALRFDLAVDLMDYFSGRTFEGEPGVSRGLEPREAVAAVEGATGCDLNFFEDFWLGSPGEIVESVHVGPYTKQSLLDFSYYAKELSRRYGFADSDILEIARHLPEECPDRFAAVKAYLDCEYVPDGDAPDEKTYRWGDFLEIAGGDARYAAMLVDRTAAGESEEGLHPETLVDQDIRDGEAFMLAGRPIAPEDAYDLPGTVRGLYKELADNVDRSGMLFRDWRGFAAGTDADDMALNDWIASETTATGAAWARCFNPYCGPDEKTLNTSEIIDTLRRFESPSYIVRGPIEDIESLPVGYYWCPDALDPDPSYNGYLLNVFAGFDGRGLPGKFFELFGGVTLNDVPSFGFDGERVIEAFDGTPVHMSVPVEVDGEKVWTCGYDFCWCETVAPDFSRARGHFPDATVAAWAAARNVNQSDGDLGLKERM